MAPSTEVRLQRTTAVVPRRPMIAIVCYFLSAHGLISQSSAFHTPKSYPTSRSTQLSLAAAAETETRTAPKVVVGKFDSYASTFEEHLVVEVQRPIASITIAMANHMLLVLMQAAVRAWQDRYYAQ